MRKLKFILHYIRYSCIRAGLLLWRPKVVFRGPAIIGSGTFFGKDRDISIGRNFFCGRMCHLSCHAEIGDDVMFASFVGLVGGDHKIDYINTLLNKSGRDVIKKIVIESNVWVGHGAIIMNGVRIGSGSVVGAGAVVTKNVEKNSIVGGNPASYIRHRKF